MTHLDDDLSSALRGPDLSWLSERLDRTNGAPELLRRLLRHGDARVRHLGLLRLRERTAARRTPAELRELGALLPRDLGSPAVAESALVLAELYRELWTHLPERELPSWREAALPVPAQVAWLRAEILTRPERLREEPGAELLLQALRDLDHRAIPAPEALIGELSRRAEPALQAAALDLARGCVRDALLAPARARACLEALLDAERPSIVAGALRELAEPWAALTPLPAERLAALVQGDSEVADAALVLAACQGLDAPLRGVIADGSAAPRLRQRALALLGELGRRDDVGEILAAAAGDPLLFGLAAAAGLRALHRRGVFPSPEHATALVELALADPSIPAGEVASIAFTCRDALLEALGAAPADDPGWPRRLEILVALDAQGAPRLPVGEVIAKKLREHGAIEDERSLALREKPGHFLRTLAMIRRTAAEPDVIAALPRAPADALDALRAIGGRRTVEILRAGLGLDGSGQVAPPFRADRAWAISILWHLTEDPAERRALLDKLRPGQVPPLVAADLGIADDAELRLLHHAVSGPDVTPAAALVALATAGDARALPAIADLLLRAVTDLAAAWEPGGSPAPDPARAHDRSARPVIPVEVVTAVRALGSRLHRRRKIRPMCLLDAASEKEAGDALFASLVLDLLDRPEPGATERAILLEALHDAPWRRTLPRVHRLLRHGDPHVRKAAIALLARDGAESLSASLTILTGAGDVQTARQALLALGGMKARWAAPAIAACLDHPNMNIKKTAAEALVSAGAPEVVPRLLFWLGRHDNPGFRASLVGALEAILGPGYLATLLAAAEAADEDRRRDLLLDALSGRLSANAVRQAVRQGSPAAPRILARVLAGEMALFAATPGDLAAEIEALGGEAPAPAPPAASPPPGLDDAHTLARAGWNEALARRLLALPQPLDAPVIAALRPLLPSFLRLAGADPALREAALRLALRSSSGFTQEDRRLLARHTDLILEGAGEAPAALRDELLVLLESLTPSLQPAEALGIAARVRALPPAPGARRSPLTLLRKLGALLVRADVDQALVAAARAADPWHNEPAVLREAFGRVEVPRDEPKEGMDAFRGALRCALSDPEALSALRAAGGSPGSRARLAALIDAFPSATGVARALLLDWMEALQPLDAPPWTLAERAAVEAARAAREPRPDDLDQPRSAALRDRLLEMLEAGSKDAAEKLLAWPDEAAHVAVVRAYLGGVVELRATPVPARALLRLSVGEIDGGERPHPERDARLVRLLAAIEAQEMDRFFDVACAIWRRGAAGTAAAARSALSRIPPDVRAERILAGIEAGQWDLVELFDSAELLRTPELTALVDRMRREGRAGDAGRIRFADGPFRTPEDAAGDGKKLASLRALPERTAAAPPPGPTRADLVRIARTGDAEEARRALSKLAEAPDAELGSLLQELLGDRRPRIRLHAHRLLRNVVDRATYLRASTGLLSDPLPDVVRSAVRILAFAPWLPAVPAMVELLLHPHPTVRRAAADGLAQVGAPAIPALVTARSRARPDRRHAYDEVLARIGER